MSGALTKRKENFNHRFHRLTQVFLFSVFSASLRFVIFVGDLLGKPALNIVKGFGVEALAG